MLDRSLALGAQAFSALLPLMILLQAAQPGSRSIAADAIERFDLHDEAAETVREAFAATSEETTIAGVSVLVPLGLAWIAFLALYASLHALLDEILEASWGRQSRSRECSRSACPGRTCCSAGGCRGGGWYARRR